MSCPIHPPRVAPGRPRLKGSAQVNCPMHTCLNARYSKAALTSRNTIHTHTSLSLSTSHGGTTAAEDQRCVVAPDDLVRPGAAVPVGLRLGVAEPEVPDLAAADVEDAPVDLEPAVADRLLDGEVGHEHLDARLDVELRDAHPALLVVADGRQLVGVGVAHRLERRQPRVEDAAHPRVRQRRRRAAARRVPAQHDVLDLEVRHRVLDHRRRVDVGRRDDVGDVAVHEHVARLEAEDRRLGAAGVGTTEPDCLFVSLVSCHILRLLAAKRDPQKA